MSTLAVVIVAHNNRQHLERCLDGVTSQGHDVVLVDNASDDDGVALVRDRYPNVRIIELDRNVGYGAANNEGMKATESDYVLVVNPDAWPLGNAVERLVAAADAAPWAAVVAPRLLTPGGEVSPSVRGFPTLWRLATEYLFLRWIAPWTSTFNDFYGAGIDQSRNVSVDWAVGAALLVRRDAFDEVGGFDPEYFMYDDEVDLCYRLRQVGWEVLFVPFAEFVHVGGGSSHPQRTELYREQLRSHVRFLSKHHGMMTADRGRTLLLTAMRLRRVVFWGRRRKESADAAAWLAQRDVAAILSESPLASRARTRV